MLYTKCGTTLFNIIGKEDQDSLRKDIHTQLSS